MFKSLRENTSTKSQERKKKEKNKEFLFIIENTNYGNVRCDRTKQTICETTN